MHVHVLVQEEVQAYWTGQVRFDGGDCFFQLMTLGCQLCARLLSLAVRLHHCTHLSYLRECAMKSVAHLSHVGDILFEHLHGL